MKLDLTSIRWPVVNLRIEGEGGRAVRLGATTDCLTFDHDGQHYTVYGPPQNAAGMFRKGVYQGADIWTTAESGRAAWLEDFRRKVEAFGDLGIDLIHINQLPLCEWALTDEETTELLYELGIQMMVGLTELAGNWDTTRLKRIIEYGSIGLVWGYWCLDDFPKAAANGVAAKDFDLGRLAEAMTAAVRQVDPGGVLVFGQQDVDLGRRPDLHVTDYTHVPAVAPYLFPWRDDGAHLGQWPGRYRQMVQSFRDAGRVPCILPIVQASYGWTPSFPKITGQQIADEVAMHRSLGAAAILFYNGTQTLPERNLWTDPEIAEAIRQA